MGQLHIFDPSVDNSSDTHCTESGDLAPLVPNHPSSTHDQGKRHKITLRNVIICATFIITIVNTILMIFFLTKKQYSTSLIVGNSSKLCKESCH